jgi:hypothetical protein
MTVFMQNQNKKQERNKTMSKEEQSLNLDVLNDLEFDTSDVDTSRPYLSAGEHLFTVKSVQVLPSKKNPANKNLRVDFALTNPTEAENGTMLNAGFPLSRYFSLQQSDNPKAPDYRVDIVKMLEAVYSERVAFTAETVGGMVGREVICKLKVTESDEFGTSNEITAFKAV